MAGVISYAGYVLMFFGGGQRSDSPLGAIGALAMILLAPIGAIIIQLAISRSREYAADSYAGELTGSPLATARSTSSLKASLMLKLTWIVFPLTTGTKSTISAPQAGKFAARATTIRESASGNREPIIGHRTAANRRSQLQPPGATTCPGDPAARGWSPRTRGRP